MIKFYLTDLNNSLPITPATPIAAPVLYLSGCITVTTVELAVALVALYSDPRLRWLRCTVTLGCVGCVVQ
jgi:hypothetical protein